MKEKRGLAELILQNFDTFEPQLIQQKEGCIEKVKQIVQNLQEKVKELGTNLLEKVNNVCQERERDFSSKKKDLERLNQSFEYTEQFMSDILKMSAAMDIMKAQDLLTCQVYSQLYNLILLILYGSVIIEFSSNS